MKKKYLLLITAILLTALVFTACSGGNTKAGESGKGDTGAVTASSDAAGEKSTNAASAEETKTADTTLPESGTSGNDESGTSGNDASGTSGTDTSGSGTEESGAQTGIMGSFTATDVDGNTVDPSIFADYKLTMVNVWATFCGPCLREMPDLGELADEYKDKGVRIVGLVSDTLDQNGDIDDSQVEAAKEIIADTGADYLHILPSTDLFGLLSQISSVPTTFFVDSEGRQVGMAELGSKEKDEWVEIIDRALAEVQE